MVTAITVMDNGSKDVKDSKGSGRVLVYGNVDNDDYLDKEDLEALEKIVSSGNWNKYENPFADVNYDGKVDQKDIDALKSILNKEKNKVYYIGSSGDTYYMHYPLGDKKIAVSSDYGMMMAQILGVYDRITAGAADRVLKQDTSRYPGCNEFKDLGNYTSANYATFVENLLDSGCQVLMGQVTKSVYDMIRDTGQELDLILLSPSAEIQQNGIDVVTSILTCGTLLDAGDKAREYAAYCDNLTEYIHENIKGEKQLKFVNAYNTNNAVTTTVHTTQGKNGSMTGVIWNLSHLPLTSDIPWNELDTNGRSLNVEIETIIQDNPDIIILSAWGKVAVSDSPDKGQAYFDEVAKYFKETNAYKNGQVYAFSYEVYGTYLGVGGLALLSSYIWPGSFSEEEGWDLLQDAVDRFTMIEGDVRNMGGLLPYKVNCTA